MLHKSLMCCILFLSFAESFSREKTHNMVVLMLDPCLKGMDCIMDYIHKDQVAILMRKYDELIAMPLLKATMGFLNPNQVVGLVFPSPKLPPTSIGLFGLATSTQEEIESLFKVELSLFHKFNVENDDGLDPLIWWFINKSRFSNVGFLA